MKSFHRKTTNNKVSQIVSMASLYPSQLKNRRYIAFKVLAEGQIQITMVVKAVQQAFLHYVGRLQYAEAQLQYLTQLTNSNTGIFRINDKYDNYLRASFCMIDEVEKTKVIIRSTISTGILNKAKKCL